MNNENWDNQYMNNTGNTYQNNGYVQQPYQDNGYGQDSYQNNGYGQQQYQDNGYYQQQYQDNGYYQQPYQNNGYAQQPYQNNGYGQQPYQYNMYGQPYVMNNKKVKPSNPTAQAIGIIGAIAVIVSCFLEFATVSSGFYSLPIKLFDEGKDGPFFLVIAILAIVFFSIKMPLGALIVSIINAVFVCMDITTIQDAKHIVGSFGTVSYGVGFWVMVVGAVMMLVAAIMYKMTKTQ